MLWESVDPQQALTRRFRFAHAGHLAEWVTRVLADTWGIDLISCDQVVISAGNALVWITTSRGRMIVKWSAVPWLFPRLANVARLTSWLDRRGLPVAAPLPALSGDLQVELDGFSVGLQSVVEGSMLDVDDLAHVHAAGAVLAKLHLAMAEYPHHGRLGAGGQAESTPLRTRVEHWLASAVGGPWAVVRRSGVAEAPSAVADPATGPRGRRSDRLGGVRGTDVTPAETVSFVLTLQVVRGRLSGAGARCASGPYDAADDAGDPPLEAPFTVAMGHVMVGTGRATALQIGSA